MLLDVRAGRYPIVRLLDIGGTATLDSYGPVRHLSPIPKAHFAFLDGCLDDYETADHLILHANYEPDLSMGEPPVGMLRGESLRPSTPGPHDSGRTVIVGHTSQEGGEILDLGDLKCIETFC